ncbi:MAG: SPOR domain-containing protein [Bacteroidales bacterium]
MKSIRLVIILIITAVSVSSCDWLRSKLGMETSEDLEAIKQAAERRSEEQRIIDSIKLAQRDTMIVGDTSSAILNPYTGVDSSANQQQKADKKQTATQQKPQSTQQKPQAVQQQSTQQKPQAVTQSKQQVQPQKSAPIVNNSADYKFYVIAGSFKEDANAQKMVNYLKKGNFKPIVLNFKNGFKVVASGGFNNANDAYNERRKLLEYDFSPEDVWIYDINQKLHIK